MTNTLISEESALVDELRAKLDALAIENAALKTINDDRQMFIMNGVQLGYIKVPTIETDPALETIRIAVSPQEPTPATSAALAAIRAKEHADFIAVFNEHIKTVGLDDDELVTVRECRAALKQVEGQQ